MEKRVVEEGLVEYKIADLVEVSVGEFLFVIIFEF